MLESLSDQKLLVDIVGLVKIEKQSTLKVLEYLFEIDSRRLWLKEGYSSLFDFCVRYLNYSEGEAARRIQATRCMGRVGEIKALLEENAVSLTGISLIAPFLTKENAGEILPQVQGKSTRQIEEVLFAHFPESRREEEFLKLPFDAELKDLLEAAQIALSEKDKVLVLKKALRKLLAKKPTRKTWPKKHTHYVPQAIQRELKESSDGACTFLSPSGVRCNQTAHLQIDHVRAWAKGGSSWDKGNLRLLCKAHNLLRAKQDFPNIAREMFASLLTHDGQRLLRLRSQRRAGRSAPPNNGACLTLAMTVSSQHRARDVGRGYPSSPGLGGLRPPQGLGA